MKNVFFKAIIIMMVALVSQAAGAQIVSDAYKAELLKQQPSPEAVEMCRQYLLVNPTAIIEVRFDEPQYFAAAEAGVMDGKQINAGDTLALIGYNVYAVKDAAGNIKAARQPVFTQKVLLTSAPVRVANYDQVVALDRKAVETMFEYDITSGHRRDVRGYQMSTSMDSPDGKAIKKAADKDGWAVQVEGAYQYADQCCAFTGLAGLSYTGKWWQVSLMGGATRTFYSDNAIHDGKYWAYGTEATLWLQPFKFDKFDQHRLYLGGGTGWEWYRTDSKETERGFLQSEGNYIYPVLGVQYEYRMFATGNSFYAKLQWRQKKLIVQNADREVSNALEVSVGFRLGFMRNRISH